MGCDGSKPHPPHGVAIPTPKSIDKWWNEPTNKDDRVLLENGEHVAKGKKEGRIYVAHQNAPDKTTRYWFQVNPGNTKLANFKLGAHRLSKDNNEEG